MLLMIWDSSVEHFYDCCCRREGKNKKQKTGLTRIKDFPKMSPVLMFA